MKTYQLLIISLFLFVGTSFAQTKIEIGEKHKLFSSALDEEREYWVYLPPNYNDTIYAPEKYPVVYFLDGDRHFHSLTGVHDFFSKGPYASLPQMIMVGILTTKNRARDLTPTYVNKAGKGREYEYPTSGGAKQFLSFIENELIPKINNSYRTNGYKTLIGHSFGGLTVLNTLLEKHELFNSFIAIDPSVWWDETYVLKKAKENISKLNLKDKTLFLARASNHKKTVNKLTKTHKEKIDFHLQAIIDFKEVLDSVEPNGFHWKYQFFEEEDHGTISLPAEFYGLRYIFDGYQLPVKTIAEKPEMTIEFFEKLSKKMGFQMNPAESRLDWIANYCFKTKRPENAIKLLKINLKYYPNSENVYMRLSDAYKGLKNNASAKTVLEKGLKTLPNSERIQNKIKELKIKKEL